MLRKAVFVILAVALIVFSVGTANAYIVDGMNSGTTPFVNPGGLGDGLYYGYFNVRGNLNLFNVINTSSTDGVKVRIVFREGKDSNEILDFSICLSRGDVWTAYLADDGTAGHIYGGVDTDTITAPDVTSSGQQFKYGASNSNKHIDGTSISADDTREGYFEIISLSAIPNYDKNASSTSACVVGGSVANCIRSATDCANWGATLSSNTPDPANVIMGNNAIFELATLGTYSYNAVAFANALLATADPGPGSELSIISSMSSGCDVTDQILNKEKILSPYDIMSSLGGETELIVLFPTRKACHGSSTASTTFPSSGYKDQFFDCTKHADTSNQTKCTAYCTKISVDVWDDKEHKLNVLDFSPGGSVCLPYELNVIKVGGSAIWNSTLASSFSVGSYTLGWIGINMGSGVSSTHAGAYSGMLSSGLSAIAYTTQSFLGSAATYMVPAMYTANIVVSP